MPKFSKRNKQFKQKINKIPPPNVANFNAICSCSSKLQLLLTISSDDDDEEVDTRVDWINNKMKINSIFVFKDESKKILVCSIQIKPFSKQNQKKKKNVILVDWNCIDYRIVHFHWFRL